MLGICNVLLIPVRLLLSLLTAVEAERFCIVPLGVKGRCEPITFLLCGVPYSVVGVRRACEPT